MYRFTDTEGAKPMDGLIALLNVKRFETNINACTQRGI